MSMGINYDDYLKAPDSFSATNLNKVLQQTFGKGVSPQSMGKFQEMLEDEDVVGERGAFVTKMSDALSGLFKRDKKGKVNASDAKALAKMLDQYYSLGIKSVDSEGLLRAIIAASPSLQQANALFTDKQGARFLAVARDPALFADYVKKLVEAPEGFAKKIGEERMGGFSGASKRAEGSWKNVETSLGRAWDPEMTAFKNAVAALNQGFVEAGESSQRVVSGLAGVAVALIGFETAVKTASLLGIIGPGAASALSRAPWLSLPYTLTAWGGYEAAKFSMSSITHNADAVKPLLDNSMLGAMSGDAALAAAISNGGIKLPSFTLDDIRNAVYGPSQGPELKGTAEINSRIEIIPGAEFYAVVKSTVRNEINNVRINGAPASGTAGSTGTSMPESAPAGGGN
jgi:hypothetical protein